MYILATALMLRGLQAFVIHNQQITKIKEILYMASIYMHFMHIIMYDRSLQRLVTF